MTTAGRGHSFSEVGDPGAWNRFVESARYGAFTQLWEWGELRRAAGWRPLRVAVTGADGPVAGVQLLLRRIPVIGWHLAYAPRGPIGALDDAAIRAELVDTLRRLGRAERIATVRADPEVTPDDAFGRALGAAPWRAAAKVQPPRTRVIDLRASEDELRAGMHRKHRQYVNKAERAGVEIERFDGATPAAVIGPALADFNRIYRLTADRAGFVARDPSYYELVWATFAPTGRVRLMFAVRDGERVATLFHFTCGRRAVESYGGMIDAGAESRANYLLKWRAICEFRAQGFEVYDLWGLATGGIEKFKAGFGGRQVEYVGARDLPLQPALDAFLRLGLGARSLAQAVRRRVRGTTSRRPVTAPLEAD